MNKIEGALYDKDRCRERHPKVINIVFGVR